MEMDCATPTVVIRPDGDATRAADTARRDGETHTQTAHLRSVSSLDDFETDLSQTYALNIQESRPTRDSRGDALNAWDPLDADGDATATTRQDATRFTDRTPQSL